MTVGTIIDLSLTISEKYPAYWPGATPFGRQVTATYASEKPYFTEGIWLDEHTGTHFDAPVHFVPPNPETHVAATTGDAVDLGQLCGSAVVVRIPELSAAPGVSPEITPEHVLAWEATNGQIAPGEIVLFWTGWDRYYVAGSEGEKYVSGPLVGKTFHGWPAPAVAVMELLLERGVRCVGTDGPSMGSAHDGAPVHVAALSRGALFVECLTNLDKLPPRGATFCFLPLKVEGSSGGPGRAIAWI